ncbi:MAG: sigma 54-interacting transcriptional regulator [Verrucomicrobiales bacterium]|nr:sigma 54-interacting transcriptional regulator [Verrucomicrobiales bacterium]
MSPSLDITTDETALRLVVEGTVSETGVEFFRALVRNLATAMRTSGAWVTEYLPKERRLRAYAFWLDGRFVEHFEYPIAGTACEPVVEQKRLVHIPDRLLELYPHDPDVISLQAVSYLGVPLLDTQGEVMGHLSVLDSQPLHADSRLISLFEIFAARAAAEQRRLRQEAEVREREQELAAVLDSTMDAVVVLDDHGILRRANPAAERLFGCPVHQLIGQDFREFLPIEGATRLGAFLQEIDTQPAGRSHLWIPQSFHVRRRDKTVFPAEATLSRFVNRGRVYHTLILRNVDDRLAAERRIQSLSVQAEYLQAEIRALHDFGEIIGQSPALRRVLHDVEQVATTDAAVLIQGETGTGKELFARAIHTASHRRSQPLVTVNCAAIPATLIESEFFGHEKGAFTGATSRRDGRFALADGGTIFLDEIGELPMEMQAKLLRVLQEGTFEPVGSAATRKVNVRVVAATNRDLAQEVASNRFRQDLFYRLNVFPIQLPPLRERIEDVPALAATFARRYAQRIGRAIAPLSPDDTRRLQRYGWPGNVRELQNVIERAVITAVDGRLNLDRALPEVSAAASGPTAPRITDAPQAIHTLRDLEEMERSNLARALEQSQGRISGSGGAATLLGMNPSTLRSRMKALGVAVSKPAPVS